jgi:leader peptidase (prepilin peptidase) / N-methyltransferase
VEGVQQPYAGIYLFFVTALGLIFGSFGTALAYRLPRGKSAAEGRSKCPNCGQTIRAIDNVPLLSYLALRGRCRNCGHKISPRYPLAEAATAILFLAVALRFDLSWEAAFYALFFWALVVLTVIDLEHQLLPNKIVYPLLALTYASFALSELLGSGDFRPSATVLLGGAGAAAVALVTMWPYEDPPEVAGEEDETVMEAEDAGSPARELAFGVLALVVWAALLMMALLDGPIRGFEGALVGGGLFSVLLFGVALVGSAVAGRTAMGGGDIKLALGLGAVLGYLEAPGVVMMGMFLSFLAGGVLSVGVLVATRDRKMHIPFGPFLALGTVLAAFFGRDLVDAYLTTL